MRTDSNSIPTPSRGAARRESTRRELVRAGRRLLSEEGLYEFRVEDLTKHAGIAKGTLYLHFRSKEELVLAVVTSGFEELRQYVTARLGSRPDSEGIAAAIFASHVEFFAENLDLMRIFHQVRGALKFTQPRWRPLRACLRAHLEFLSHRLDREDGGSLPLRKRKDLAIFLFGCASGTCSALVSAFPEVPLRSWGLPWSGPLGGAASAFMQSSAGSTSRATGRRSAP